MTRSSGSGVFALRSSGEGDVESGKIKDPHEGHEGKRGGLRKAYTAETGS